MLILQLITILGFAWLLRKPAKSIGLPPVIGEMLAGFLLGPTFFGSVAPQLFTSFFSQESIRSICALGTLVVTMYCFVIGLEFDTQHLQGRRTTLLYAALISALLPALAGYFAAGYISPQLTPTSVNAFRLTVALCFSVTAFPVLLRIVEDSGISSRPSGIFSVGISAILELITWASLPIILALAVAGNATNAVAALAWVIGFLIIWLIIVRQGLRWLSSKNPHTSPVNYLFYACVGIVSALITERLGLHAIFGAFVGGLIIPREASFTLAKKIKPYCSYLLSIFFASAGLKTILHFRSGSDLLILFALAILAYGVKALSTALSVRFIGNLDWNESATIGHLMCAKGAIGFAIIGACLAVGLLDSDNYSVLAMVILANTIMSAWGASFQQRLVRGWSTRLYASEL